MRDENEYLLGTDDEELRRLGFQHQMWTGEAAAAWARGGFRPGSYVLDVGCGPGYAAVDLARLVGPKGRVVGVELSDALSEYAGRHLRLLRAAELGIGTDSLHPVSLVGDGSVAALAARLGQADLDGRRFRMLFELSGVEAHAEDDWEGSLRQVGDAVVRLGGPVGRCANITYDPDSGLRDFDALRAIREYRGKIDGQVCFGVYADVVEPGRVRVGDEVGPA